MKKERSNKAIYARFAITILVCAALGGVAGFCAAMAGKNLLDSADSLNMALASLGQLWFIPGYVLLLVSTIYYLRGKALLPQAEADDDAFQESDRRLCLSLILSGAAMVWLFIALGINGQTDWVNNQAMWLGDHILRIGGLMEGVLFIVNLVVQLVWVVALQALTVKATKVIHPEKKGNVFDTKFQKDWFRSCDEAEQQQIGQCLGILRTITVTDADGLVFIAELPQGAVCQILNGFLTAAYLAANPQFTLIVYPDDGLDTKQPTDYGGGFAQPSAAVQMPEIVHCNQVDDMQAHLFDCCCGYFGRAAAVAHFARLIDQQVFTAGCGKGIDTENAAIRILRRKFIASHAAGLIGAGKPGGKADIQDILPALQRSAENLQKGVQLGL